MSADSVRDEAERLVAAAIATVSMAARSLSSGNLTGDPADEPRLRIATDSAECCVCPVCRLIAAMREPDPNLTERLATAAGDLAVAVAGVLRSLSQSGPSEPADEPDPWHAATSSDEPPPPPKKAAKKVAKKAVKKAAPASPLEDSS